MTEPLLEVRSLTKDFGGLRALHNVSFEIQSGRNGCFDRPQWFREHHFLAPYYGHLEAELREDIL